MTLPAWIELLGFEAARHRKPAGDPLAPLLFSLAFRPALDELQRALPTATIVAYLDDVYVLGRDSTDLVAAAAKVFADSAVELNLAKSAQYSVQHLRESGMAVLGSFVGPLPGRVAFLQGKIDEAQAAFAMLRKIPRQHALLLLRKSMQLLLRHLLRTLEPEGLLPLWQSLDDEIATVVSHLADTGPLDELQRLMCVLPERDGGLGLPSHAEVAMGVHQGAWAASQPRINAMLGTDTEREASSVQDVQAAATNLARGLVYSRLPPSLVAVKEENGSFLGRKWLSVLPTQSVLHIEDERVAYGLCRLKLKTISH